MYHYIAFIWDPQDSNASRLATRFEHRLADSGRGFTLATRTSGLTVLCVARTPIKAYVLPSSRGAILGCLFPKHSRNPIVVDESALSAETARAIVASRGRSLNDLYWGCYVAFLRADEPGHTFVLRDCSGKLPCFRCSHEGVTIIFSDVSDVMELGLPPFTVDFSYLAAFIHSSSMQIRNCGLRGITELLAGDCFEQSRNGLRQDSFWEPKRITLARSIDDYYEARSEMTRTVKTCIAAWSSVYPRLLHLLSGGLDSAVVLGCIAKSGVATHVMCINRFTDGEPDDERRYARLALKRARQLVGRRDDLYIDLVEQPWRARELDENAVFVPQTTKPSTIVFWRLLEVDLVNRLAEDFNADVLWTGQGGDHLFWQVQNSLSAADYITNHGFGRGLLGAVRDAADLAREPYYDVFRKAVRLGRTRGPWRSDGSLAHVAHFVNPDALPRDIDDYIAHHWSIDVEGLPKGKQLQIPHIGDVVNRHRAVPSVERAAQHHPLLSQPLIELCLQIPTYLLLKGGRQRALARDAFSSIVPAEIIRREDKGDATVREVELLRSSERFIREFLFDGLLAKEGIIARKTLEPYLVQREPFRSDHFGPLFACISAEAWVRVWRRQALRAAA